jgi:ketosteroid isomerase-like protein
MSPRPPSPLSRGVSLTARAASVKRWTVSSPNGKLDLQVTRVLEVGDLALAIGEWSFTGTGVDGEPVKLAAKNAVSSGVSQTARGGS